MPVRVGKIGTAASLAFGLGLGAPVATAQVLPEGLVSPDGGVVCQLKIRTCFDRYGPSIGLTEAFLGASPAEHLAARLRLAPADQSPGFAPAEGVECLRETGPCRVGEAVQAPLTAILYDPPAPREVSAEVRALTFGEWYWHASLYNDATETRPDEPDRYTLAFDADGNLSVRVDCNRAGGRYHLDGSRLTIAINHATRAACPPDTLDQVFMRDLAATAGFFMKAGALYLDLGFDTGTMQFERAQ